MDWATMGPAAVVRLMMGRVLVGAKGTETKSSLSEKEGGDEDHKLPIKEMDEQGGNFKGFFCLMGKQIRHD